MGFCLHEQLETCKNLASCGKYLHQGAISAYLRHQPLLLHHLEKLQGLLWDPALLANADQGIVGDCVGQHALLSHCPQNLNGELELVTLLTGTDQGAVGN